MGHGDEIYVFDMGEPTASLVQHMKKLVDEYIAQNPAKRKYDYCKNYHRW
jgi:hypothetical protein